MHSQRIRSLNNVSAANGKCVVYVMSRDQRVQDNHALLIAQKHALHEKVPLIVFFNLYSQLGIRIFQQFEFMMEGLKEVEKNLQELQIPFIVESGNARENIEKLVEKFEPSALFFDFSPLRESQKLKKEIAENIKIPCFEVDTHNIIPVWITSEKEEWAAYTIRPKIHKNLSDWLVEPEKIQKHLYPSHISHKNDWSQLLGKVQAQKVENYNPIFQPGEKNAYKTLQTFIEYKLEKYNEFRNDPSKDYQSNLSPYLHFGHISSLRIALTVKHLIEPSFKESIDVFLEELIVRKELSDNFCFYNKNYDNFEGLKPWAQASLMKHIDDKRPHLFSKEQLEFAQTYDPAWNAAQIQLITTGKIHGYMRMYWAKKILEWTQTPQQALEYTIYLNDKYHLDGYDPNGYVGIMWSIGGIHDRPWFEREIFGQVRYMNLKGLQRKFDVNAYVEMYPTVKNSDKLYKYSK